MDAIVVVGVCDDGGSHVGREWLSAEQEQPFDPDLS